MNVNGSDSIAQSNYANYSTREIENENGKIPSDNDSNSSASVSVTISEEAKDKQKEDNRPHHP